MSVRLRLVEHYDVKWDKTSFRIERQKSRDFWFGRRWYGWEKIGFYSDVAEARKLFEALKVSRGAETIDMILETWSSDG